MWQYLHFPFIKTKERRGIKSCHLRVFLHLRQRDLPFIEESPFGSLSISTFKKEPISEPNINSIKRNIYGQAVPAVATAQLLPLVDS